jgi:hypothetical protein
MRLKTSNNTRDRQVILLTLNASKKREINKKRTENNKAFISIVKKSSIAYKFFK